MTVTTTTTSIMKCLVKSRCKIILSTPVHRVIYNNSRCVTRDAGFERASCGGVGFDDHHVICFVFAVHVQFWFWRVYCSFVIIIIIIRTSISIDEKRVIRQLSRFTEVRRNDYIISYRHGNYICMENASKRRYLRFKIL